MIVNPQYEEKRTGTYSFGAQVDCTVYRQMDCPIFRELWKGFCCYAGEAAFSSSDDLVFKIGEAAQLKPPESGYRMEITPDGISASASDEKNLIYAFFALLERISPVSTRKGEERFSVDCCKVIDDAQVKMRMVHLCIFPETDLTFVRKFIRLAAFVRYTHIVIEFFGTLRFECLKELAWAEYSYSKEQIRPLLQEARMLGLEIVPMFNHWGHAAASQVMTGKHVVLDQNLTLAPLFSATGWEWKLSNPDVRALQKKIRAELIELCGEGEYFHIGCDEAYSASANEDFETVVDYINTVSEELKGYGRKTIMWGDMLLHRDALNLQTENSYYLLCPRADLQKILLNKLSRSVIIADWQYNAKHYPVETALFFKQKGFEVICCPWDRSGENMEVSAEMIKNHGLMGGMHTTWYTARTVHGIWAVAYSAALLWGKAKFQQDRAYQGCEAAALLRKLDFPNGNYQNSGWEKKQILD